MRLELCALLGWLGGWRWLQWLGACGGFDRVQGFAKPRVFCSLDFIHKGSSLVFKFLIKKRKSSELYKCFLSAKKNQSIAFWNPQVCMHSPSFPPTNPRGVGRFNWLLNTRKWYRAKRVTTESQNLALSHSEMKPHCIFSSLCIFGPNLDSDCNMFKTQIDIWMDGTFTDDVSMKEF